MTSVTADECARTFTLGWIARYGVLLDITSDHGRQFTSGIWNHLASTLGCKLHRTITYHPQSNGIVERSHQSLKASLCARLSGNNWFDDLPWVLLSLMTTPKLDLRYSPAGCTLSHQPLLPGGLLSLSPSLVPTVPCLPQHHCSPTSAGPITTLCQATHVYVRIDAHHPPLTPPYGGPFRGISSDDKTFTIDHLGKPEVVSADRVKPAILPTDDSPVYTRRGRLVCHPRRFLDEGE